MKNLIILAFVLLVFSCTTNYPETEISLADYQHPDNIALQVVAAEPLIEAPIDMSFDDQGRLWVLEMRGYMRSLSGINEDEPVGRILVMQDLDNDGVADHEVVFLDNLILPRAISHVYGGLLYAEPPQLWFVEINDDLTPGARTLVDPTYAVGGNVEHQPNGLLLNVDNWIYNAKDSKRYRRVNGQWEIENTTFRGQWGITHDPMGRLIYNDNSNLLRGDFILPNMLHRNPAFRSNHLLDRTVVADQRVYPLQATPVNRGYQPNVLDADGKLINVTAACGPVLYNGSNLPAEYNTNVFVCLPEVNLIKRNIINLDQFSLLGNQAREGEEFIITNDLGFRPVNIKNGPDGALYIVDMHRGIIQHKTYMTSYLREKYIETDLDSLTGMGRILRVAGAGAKPFRQLGVAQLSPKGLIDSLSSRNTWMRDRAQHMLHQSDDQETINLLRGQLMESTDEIFRIHALYALEGKGVWETLEFNLSQLDDQPRFKAHIIKLAADSELKINGISQPISPADSISSVYLMYYAARKGDIALIDELRHSYESSDWILEPLMGAYEGEPQLLAESPLVERMQGLNRRKEELRLLAERPPVPESLPALELFREHCAVCHGPDGEGIANLAPPLLNSEYVSGSVERLTNIVLYGLTGPITVNGNDYEFGAAMPGLIYNGEISDQEISSIISFIRNAFASIRSGGSGNLVRQVRESGRPHDASYTMQELLEYNDTFDTAPRGGRGRGGN